MREHLDRRFAGRTGENRPSNKAIAEALTDAFAVAGFAAHGLHVDGPTIKTLQRWGTELLLYDQSRYVGGYPSANVMWSACDLQAAGDGAPRARRRGRADHGERVARALIEAYRDQEEAGAGHRAPRPPHSSAGRVRGARDPRTGRSRPFRPHRWELRSTSGCGRSHSSAAVSCPTLSRRSGIATGSGSKSKWCPWAPRSAPRGAPHERRVHPHRGVLGLRRQPVPRRRRSRLQPTSRIRPRSSPKRSSSSAPRSSAARCRAAAR